MKKFSLTITGSLPLLMHNARLCDPLEPITKKVKKLTSKRNKTDEDHEELAEAEFGGGLYFDPDIGPYMPGENIAACILKGARLNKLGTKVERGVLITTDINPLAYDGPRTIAELYADKNFVHRKPVVVGTSRIIRTRPMFPEWRTQAEGLLDESQIDVDQLVQAIENAGLFIGLGDYRPRYGRFTAVLEEV